MTQVSVEGSGGGEATFSGPPVTISGNGGTIEPVYVEDITIDLVGNTSTITDQCGYTEVHRSGTETNWSVSVEGVVGNVQLPTLKSIAEGDDTANIQTPLLNDRGGEFVIETCSISHTDELNRMELPNKQDLLNAFTFKLDATSPQAAKDGGS